MITKPWKANRPCWLEYECEEPTLALIRSGDPDERVWEHDVLRDTLWWKDYFYIAVFSEAVNCFIAYPLRWHSIVKKHIGDTMEVYENIFDFYIKYEAHRKQLPIQWPYKTFVKNLEFYLNNAELSIYR